jgi:hypothetical protein
MKVIGLDDKNYTMTLYGRDDLTDDKSSLHLLARKLLFNIFKPAPIIEELFLPGSGGLYADFFIPLYKLVVETHGVQHYKFNPFFHSNIKDFKLGQVRDKNKIKWCEKNNIKLIELPYNEDENEWRTRIINR